MGIFCLVVASVLLAKCLGQDSSITNYLPRPVIGAFFEENVSMRQAFSAAMHLVNKCTYDHEICEKIHPSHPQINKHLFHQVEFSAMIAEIDDDDYLAVRNNFIKLAGVEHNVDISPIKNENGLSFVTGPHKSINSLYVQGLCEIYNLPHIVIRRENAWEHSSSQTINLYPDRETLNNVFLDLIKKLQWTDFVILYEDTENFLALHNIVTMYRYTHSVYGVRLSGHGTNYSEPLLIAKGMVQKSFLIDCGFDNLNDVLTQIQEVGMMTEDYRYVIMTLDMQAIDWRQFQYSGVNVKGFQLIDLSNPFIRDLISSYSDVFGIESVEQLRLDDALMFDAVMMFAHAYKDLNYENNQLFSATFARDFDKEFYPWREGLSLRNYLLYTEIKGLTGPLAIDGDGARRRFKMDLMNLYPTGLKKFSEWNFETAFLDFRYENLKKKPHYTVLITNNPPYAMTVNRSKTMTGNQRYEGLVVDIMEELGKALDFEYTLIMHPNTNNGECKLKKLKNYTICSSCDGVTGRVHSGDVDMAITDLTMTENRAKCVLFSTPFMNLGISILMKKPQKVITLFSFLAPFHYWVWLAIALSTIAVSILFFALGRLCPAEWTNPYPCIEEPEELQNQFTFNNAVWFTMGAILQQGSEIAPIGLSTRVLASSWYFFCLIICNTYMANLAASLYDQTPDREIDSYKDLINKPEANVKFGAKLNGSTINYFKSSVDPYHQKLYAKMMEDEEWKNKYMVKKNEDGVELALQNDTNYAFFMESSTIQYTIKQHCELEEVGKLIDQKSYAIAYLKKHQRICAAISRLEESSVLSNLRKKWWDERGSQCDAPDSGTPPPMTEEQFSGAFVVLAVGLVLSFLVTTYVSCRGIRSIAKVEELDFLKTARIEMKNMMGSKPIKPVLSKQRSTETNLTDRSCDWTISSQV